MDARFAPAEKRHDALVREFLVVEWKRDHTAGEDREAFSKRYDDLFSQYISTFNRPAAALARQQYDDRIRDAREAFQGTWLTAICEQLLRTLPRELRDMVYKYLLNGVYIDQDELESKHDSGKIGWILNHRIKGPDWHCFKPASLGPEMFREMIEVFYRKVYLEEPLTTEGDLQDFLSRDNWVC